MGANRNLIRSQNEESRGFGNTKPMTNARKQKDAIKAERAEADRKRAVEQAKRFMR